MENWTLYIVESENRGLYTGVTTDLKRRFMEHKTRRKGAKFFRFSQPKEVLFQLSGLSHSEALKLENKVKRLNRAQKLAWIARNQTSSEKSSQLEE